MLTVWILFCVVAAFIAFLNLKTWYKSNGNLERKDTSDIVSAGLSLY